MEAKKIKIMEFEQALEKEEYSSIKENIQESINRLKELISDSNFMELESEVECKKSQFSFLVKKELSKRNVHFLFGRYIGFIDALCEYISVEFKKKVFKDGLNSCDISEIPHVNDIIVSILKDEGIRHGRLAQKVGIEKSTLTGIMDKLVERGAVVFSRPGKYKYYYLTDIGKRYYYDNQVMIEAQTDIESLTEQLLLALTKEKDVNEQILKIIMALCNGSNSFKGYKSKIKEVVDPSIIFAGIPTIKQLNVMFADTSIHTINNGVVLNLNPKFGIDTKSSVISLFNDNNNDYTELPKALISDIVNI